MMIIRPGETGQVNKMGSEVPLCERGVPMKSAPVSLLALVLAIAWSAAASPVNAQITCLDCSPCVDMEEESDESLGNKAPVGDHTSVNSWGLGSHDHCVMSGGCNTQHPYHADCLFPREEQEDLLAALDILVDAVRREDAPATYRILTDRALRGSVQYVAERNAIQAQGCGGAVIAHIPLSGSAVLSEVAVAASRKGPRPWSAVWDGVLTGLAAYLL